MVFKTYFAPAINKILSLFDSRRDINAYIEAEIPMLGNRVMRSLQKDFITISPEPHSTAIYSNVVEAIINTAISLHGIINLTPLIASLYTYRAYGTEDTRLCKAIWQNQCHRILDTAIPKNYLSC